MLSKGNEIQRGGNGNEMGDETRWQRLLYADETCRSPGTVPAYTFDSRGNYISQLPFKFARRFVHQDDEIGTVPLVDLPLPSSTFPLALSIRIPNVF